MSGCPVLAELEHAEDYDPEHENPPVLSGGDYDIAAIRDCAENCKAASLAWSRGDHLRSIALILGLAPGDTAEIDGAVREMIRSCDEWRAKAAKNAGRIEELRTAAEGIWPFVSRAYSSAPLQPDFQAALDRLGAALGKG